MLGKYSLIFFEHNELRREIYDLLEYNRKHIDIPEKNPLTWVSQTPLNSTLPTPGRRLLQPSATTP